MKYFFILSLIMSSFIILGWSQTTHSSSLFGTTFFTPRSQAAHLTRRVTTNIWSLDYYTNQESITGQLHATIAYEQSFRPEQIASYFFGTNELSVKGSAVTTRTSTDILADYFGLSPSFSSTTLLEPSTRSVIGELSVHLNDRCWHFSCFIPIVWTRHDLSFSECIHNDGTDMSYPANYMGTNELTAPYTSFAQSLQGSVDFGDVRHRQYGRFCPTQTKSGIAEINATFDYLLHESDTGIYRCGFYFAAPTGNRPTATTFFEPIVGNGKHGELGIIFNGKKIIWERDGDQEIVAGMHLLFSHLFATEQRRSFDLCSAGFGSRFILLKEFDTTNTYTGVTRSVLDHTTLCCTVSVPIQCELIFMFSYRKNCLSLDCGYSAWIRSKERVHLNTCSPEKCTYHCAELHTQRLGLKGIQDATNQMTESSATLSGAVFSEQNTRADATSPVFLAYNDINTSSAASPSQLTHGFFGAITYFHEEKEEEPCFIHSYSCGFEAACEGNRNDHEFYAIAHKPTRSHWSLWFTYGIEF
ncbi:MAG: hypothetical protein WBQ73_01735 [Candidatus Babeliales bacterium]